MGNSQTVLRAGSRNDDADKAGRQLLKRYPGNGDSCLIRAIRSSTDGLQARRRLEAHLQALRQYWDGPKTSASSSPLGGVGQHAQLRQLLDAQNNKGETALALAASLGQVDAVQFLLEQGSNPWLADRLGGRLPIHNACLAARPHVVRLLLEQLPSQWLTDPADERVRYLEATTISGFTPLHCAAASGDGPTLKAVLAHKPRLHTYNPYDSYECGMELPAGTTPMHVAASKGSSVVAKELLRHFHQLGTEAGGRGQDPRVARDSHGMLPWQVAYNVHIRHLAEMLHPSVPLSMIFAVQSAVPTLQALASAALQRHLLKVLDSAEHPQQDQQSALETGDFCPASRMASSNSITPPMDIAMRPQGRLSCCGKSGCDRRSSSSPSSAADASMPSLPRSAMRRRCQAGCSSRAGSYSNACGDAVDSHLGNDCETSLAERASSPSNKECGLTGWGDAAAARPMAMRARAPPYLGARLAAMTSQAEQGVKTPPSRHAPASDMRTSVVFLDAEEEEEGQQVSACDICMDAEARMELAPCAHRLCVGCARRMVQDMKLKPVDCPFCRGHIAGFMAVV